MPRDFTLILFSFGLSLGQRIENDTARGNDRCEVIAEEGSPLASPLSALALEVPRVVKGGLS